MDHWQVVWQLEAAEAPSREQLETDLEHFVARLVEKASGLALGPVGSIDFRSNTVELEFTLEAARSGELYDKLGRIAETLFDDKEYEFTGTTARRAERELVPA